ncbi:hypothetical protein [Desulfovibrio psychrotolerans]|uniref:Uncharacterized protein n=1 Tax=Desulfovibrio psychrotolerans TaxID=415242 RepID=A0A7J0BVN4_9BACT|nr:hypothetical protein [Desulfovibrio psychrotolerans]GFM37733.1 hypothetical protein DSM19430T_24170 [Desulfovibrio psychrotolerans]
MSFVSKIADFFSGGIVSTIADTVKDYFPPSMSEGEKAALATRIREAEHRREVQLMQLAVEADKEVTRRAAELEGTAADLKTLPVVGRLIIFVRGCQRPLWGLFTMYMDWQVFSGGWQIELSAEHGWTPHGLAFWTVNLLVLGFLFGERTVRNLLPLVTQFMGTRATARETAGPAKG